MRTLVTGPDAQWAAARDGKNVVLLAGGAPPPVGQLALPFDGFGPFAEPAGRDGEEGPGGPGAEIHELLPRPADAPALAPVAHHPAEQWLARALQLEDRDPVAAIDAYRRSLRLRPECTEAWINLGRMFAESGDTDAAHECFSSAIELDPGDATAYYNLGVIAQDAGKEADAIGMYRRALELDPHLAEAHYNLATLFDQSGDSRAAIRHINEYRKLTR